MSAFVEVTKESKKKSKHSEASPSNIMVKSEIYLNRAFDGLNRCKSRTQSVPSELADIIAGAVKSGIKVYDHALHLHRLGRYKYSKKYAKDVCLLCTLLNNLAEEQTENTLDLALPPKMRLVKTKEKARSRHPHPSLNMLQSFIRQRLKQASKFYGGRLAGHSEILSEISKDLKLIENYH